MSMRMRSYIPLVLASLYSLTFIATTFIRIALPGVHWTSNTLLLFFLAPIVLCGLLLYAGIAKQHSRLHRALPVLILLSMLPTSLALKGLAHSARESFFRSRLPVYEASLVDMRTGPSPATSFVILDQLPRHAGLCCFRAWGRLEADRSFRATFHVNRHLTMVFSPIPLDTGTIGGQGPVHRTAFAPSWYTEVR